MSTAAGSSSARSGFTLVEMLAVVAIIGLVTGITAVRLAATSDAAALTAASARWRDLDARARLFARAAASARDQSDEVAAIDAVVMRLSDERERVSLIDVASGDRLITVRLPRRCRGHLGKRSGAQSTPTDSIAFDHAGRSVDYEMIIEIDDGARRDRWSVLGLTGAIVEVAP